MGVMYNVLYITLLDGQLEFFKYHRSVHRLLGRMK